ncbi:unnamed protein product [Paramecium pentaurelia]|uniref:Uncharacterized protein n=1 Tax=Paramecium pentaurelia TaxID=43138 RepID=A0A8S1X962_9CILI|nr:unnamed protein product [Paramecium pentaurelia]
MKQNQVCRFSTNRYLKLYRAIAINHDNTLIIAAAELNIKAIQVILPPLSQSEAFRITITKASLDKLKYLKVKIKILCLLQCFSKNSITEKFIYLGFRWQYEYYLVASQFIRIYNTNQSERLMYTRRNMFKYTYSIRDLIISGSYDKKIKFWSLPSTKLLYHGNVHRLLKNIQLKFLDYQLIKKSFLNISDGRFQQNIMKYQIKNISRSMEIQIMFYKQSCFYILTYRNSSSIIDQRTFIFLFTITKKNSIKNQKQNWFKVVGNPAGLIFPQLYLYSVYLLLSKNDHYLNLIRLKFSSSKSDLESNLEQAINLGSNRRLFQHCSGFSK